MILFSTSEVLISTWDLLLGGLDLLEEWVQGAKLSNVSHILCCFSNELGGGTYSLGTNYEGEGDTRVKDHKMHAGGGGGTRGGAEAPSGRGRAPGVSRGSPVLRVSGLLFLLLHFGSPGGLGDPSMFPRDDLRST